MAYSSASRGRSLAAGGAWQLPGGGWDWTTLLLACETTNADAAPAIASVATATTGETYFGNRICRNDRLKGRAPQSAERIEPASPNWTIPSSGSEIPRAITGRGAGPSEAHSGGERRGRDSNPRCGVNRILA